MATTAFELMATLGLDSSSYEEGLNNAESTASRVGTRIASAARVGAMAIAATTTAVVAGSTAFVNGVSNVAEYADNIDKMSQKLGMSAETYQEWDFIMQHAGTSIDHMQSAMRTLASSAETGKEAFDRLGISQEEIANMSQEELFAATIEGLQNVEDETERTYLAGQLLGRGATDLGALLNMSSEDVENMRSEVHELGGVMSDEAVSAGAQFQDSLQNMQTALRGVGNNLLGEFLPSFSTVMDGLALVFSGDEGGMAIVEQGVNDFADKMNEILPRFLEIGGSILGVLGDAIIDNLPTLISTGSTVISRLGRGLISNAPLLISSAIQIISELSMGLIESAPELLSASLEIMMTLGNQLVENLPTIMGSITEIISELVLMFTDPTNLSMLIELSLRLMIAIADGLVQAIPTLVSVIPQVIGNLIMVIISEFPNILSTIGQLLGDLAMMVLGLVGGLMGQSYDEVMDNLMLIIDTVSQSFDDFITGLTSWITDIGTSISQMWTDIKDWFTNGISDAMEALGGWWDEIVSWFNNLIESATTWASDMIDNFVSGITNGVSRVGSAVSSIADQVRSLIGFSEPEVGPLSNFHTYAPDMIDLFTQGIYAGKYDVSDAFNEVLAKPTIDLSNISSMQGVNNVVPDNIPLQPIIVQNYIGNEMVDEVMVNSSQRTNYISGGRG